MGEEEQKYESAKSSMMQLILEAPELLYKAWGSFLLHQHSRRARYALGYHGTSNIGARTMCYGKPHFQFSTNTYDWLGSGVYFFQDAPHRAWDWARNPPDLREANFFDKISNGSR